MVLKEQILEVMEGPHVAAMATIAGALPAVRFMVLNGFEDMTLVGATAKNSRKVEQLKENPSAAISVWSGKDYKDPYVVIQAKGEVREDLETKKRYWNPMFEEYFKSVDNSDYVVLKFSADEITYFAPNMTGMEVWKR